MGIYEDAWTKAQLKLMLGSCGLSESDITAVPAPSDTALLLLAKKVDATTGVTNGEQAEIDTRARSTRPWSWARTTASPTPTWTCWP